MLGWWQRTRACEQCMLPGPHPDPESESALNKAPQLLHKTRRSVHVTSDPSLPCRTSSGPFTPCDRTSPRVGRDKVLPKHI